jgi:hypothetical protein
MPSSLSAGPVVHARGGRATNRVQPVGAAVFETERLRAVLWCDDPADPAFAAYSQPEMVRHLGNSATICSPLPVGDG